MKTDVKELKELRRSILHAIRQDEGAEDILTPGSYEEDGTLRAYVLSQGMFNISFPYCPVDIKRGLRDLYAAYKYGYFLPFLSGERRKERFINRINELIAV